MSTLEVRTYGPEAKPRVGFFTDTSLCIGCKACEVACKEWNGVPAAGQSFTGDSYDNTGSLGADTWRHVAFVEQRVPLSAEDGHDLVKVAAARQLAGEADLRWLMSSDVCKHCTHAACLEVCPTGALYRTQFGSVDIHQDVCIGCRYCVGACPFGVIEYNGRTGRVNKCILCQDRLETGEGTACAKSCPTSSLTFGKVDDLKAMAAARVRQLHAQGKTDAYLSLIHI